MSVVSPGPVSVSMSRNPLRGVFLKYKPKAFQAIARCLNYSGGQSYHRRTAEEGKANVRDTERQ